MKRLYQSLTKSATGGAFKKKNMPTLQVKMKIENRDKAEPKEGKIRQISGYQEQRKERKKVNFQTIDLCPI